VTVTGYMEQVRAALADVPPGEREELLADVEGSLADGEGSPEERLGPPDRFAQELRLAAGLEPATAKRAGLADRVRPLAQRVSIFAPLWWIARAYVAVTALGLLTGATWPDRPVHFVPMLHSRTWTIAICLAALVASIWLGVRRVRWEPALNVVLAVAAVPVLVHDIRHRSWQTPAPPAQIVVAATPVDGLAYGGTRVLNVYAYDRAGRLLHDVRLYDQAGHPLNVGATKPAADPLRRQVRTRGGTVVLNAFPIRYFQPGTSTIAHPNAAPRARVAPLR
jgi:hypothetical protein